MIKLATRGLFMPGGSVVEGLVARVVVMSEARRRKLAEDVRAGRGVEGLWVERKVVSQDWVGKRDFWV
jgi:hypothetical protein